MNNDLISREALKKKIQARHDNGNEDFDKGYNIGLGTAIDLIDNAPTVEITEEQAIDKLHETGWIIRHDKEMTERPQGKWIFDSEFTEFGNPYGTYKCDKCGGHSSKKYPFCFWCGAEMRPTETLSETAGKVADDCLNRIMGGGI